jgi:hypothetical protein
MLVHDTEVLSCAWLIAIALTALCTRPWRPAAGRPSLCPRGEPPAVVSLLAGRLARDGYPATLLDLAARGWIGLDEAEPSRVMCRPGAGRADGPGLTAYGRRALARTLALLEAAGAGCLALADTATVRHHATGDIILVTFTYLVFRVALIGSRTGRTAGTAMLAVAGDRRIAYAAALGAAPDAVAAFSSSADRDHAWSSFGGSWHRVLLGRADTRYMPGPLGLAGITAFGCFYGGIVLVVLAAEGPLWAAGVAVFPGCTWWIPAIWVYRSAARAARLPRIAEFDGQVLRRWTQSDGDNGIDHCIAIDDGVSQRAWALVVGSQTYAGARAGTLVHVRVDPRRNQLIAIAPAGAVRQ